MMAATPSSCARDTECQPLASLGVELSSVRKLIKAGILTSQQKLPDAPHQIRAADLSSEQVVPPST